MSESLTKLELLYRSRGTRWGCCGVAVFGNCGNRSVPVVLCLSWGRIIRSKAAAHLSLTKSLSNNRYIHTSSEKTCIT